LKFYPNALLEELRRTTKNLGMIDVPVEIGTEHLSNTRLELYCYINLLNEQ
jgi:hypothetical protein